MLVIAHRGTPRKAPENSRAAILNAFHEGAHRCEIDLQLSADDHIFVCHDDNTARTTDRPLLISHTDRHTLTQVHLENAEPLPTLEEIYTLIRNDPVAARHPLPLNCEIKPTGPDIIPALTRFLQQHPAASTHIILSSFHTSTLQALAQSPLTHIPRALCWPPTLHPSLRPVSFHEVQQQCQHLESLLQTCHTAILHPHAQHFNHHMAIWAQAQNIDISTWCALYDNEDSSLWQHLRALHVQGHCTNTPLELQRFLRQEMLSSSGST